MRTFDNTDDGVVHRAVRRSVITLTLLALLGLAVASMANCQVRPISDRPAMSPTLLTDLANGWYNRTRAPDACVYGFIETIGDSTRFHFTSFSFIPAAVGANCLWDADSLIGGFHFANPEDFDIAADSVIIFGIMDRLPQLRFFGVVHDTTHVIINGVPKIKLQVFQVIRNPLPTGQTFRSSNQ